MKGAQRRRAGWIAHARWNTLSHPKQRLAGISVEPWIVNGSRPINPRPDDKAFRAEAVFSSQAKVP
jgi:hypothetical protein